jgi:vitamin B12 transporter
MRRVFLLCKAPQPPGATGTRTAGADPTNPIRCVLARPSGSVDPLKDRHREVKAGRRRRMPNRDDLSAGKRDCRASFAAARRPSDRLRAGPLRVTPPLAAFGPFDRLRVTAVALPGYLSVALLVFVILASTVSAQSVTRLRGMIFDKDDGRPIAHATVSLSRTAYATVSDEDGRYSFDHLPEGWYTVEVSAVGYVAGTADPARVTEDATVRVDLGLAPSLDYVGEIVVRGAPHASNAGDVVVIDHRTIDDRSPLDLADLLATVPGVQVQRSGSGSGEARVSIRGSAPRQVLILVDGQQINSSATGEADLNSVPVAAIDRIEIHKGGSSAHFGPNALGGVINIITRSRTPGRPGSVEYAHETGEWKARAQSVVLMNPISSRPLGASFTFDQQTGSGDYPYRYSVQPSGELFTGTRLNNDSFRRTFHVSSEYSPSASMSIRLSGQSYNSERGLPGRANRQSLTARTEDDRTLVKSVWSQRWTPRLRSELDFGYTRLRQNFTDTGQSGSAAVKSEYVNSIYSTSLRSEIYTWAGQTVNAGFQAQSERLTHRNTQGMELSSERNARSDVGLYTSVKQDIQLPVVSPYTRLGLEASLRWDDVHTGHADSSVANRSGMWSPLVGASLSVRRGVTVTARASYGKSVCLPTLNALFWKGDARSEGNPDLKPERSEHSEAGIELLATRGIVSLSGGVTYFHSYTHDLVQWQPDFRGIWKPYNLAGALITGHEDEVTLGLFDKTLEIEYQNTITTALNREPGLNSYGKQLRYTPHYQTGLTFRADYRGVLVAYSIRWAGKRYTKIGNESWYDPYRIDDLRLAARRQFKSLRFEIEYKTYNLRNEDYTLIAHYPMPPREWHLGIKLTFAFAAAGDSRKTVNE